MGVIEETYNMQAGKYISQTKLTTHLEDVFLYSLLHKRCYIVTILVPLFLCVPF